MVDGDLHPTGAQLAKMRADALDELGLVEIQPDLELSKERRKGIGIVGGTDYDPYKHRRR